MSGTLNNLLSRGSAFLAILALALIPAAAQAPRAADRHPAHRDPRAGDRGVRSARAGAHALRRAEFRGGLILNSPHRDFGGLSALRVAADGEHFLAVTDKGHWLRGRIVYRGKAPIAIADAEMAPILGPDGRPLKSRGWYDTEALAVDGGIALCRHRARQPDRALRLSARTACARAGSPIAVPPGMKRLPHNQSIECLVVAPKGGPLAGTLIAISERGLDTGGNLLGFLIGGRDQRGGVFSLKRTDDFDVSDCAATPDGKLLVLERRFSWTRGLAIRIRSVPLAAIKPGALVDGRELIFADMGYADRQHGGPVGAPRRRRRAGADADLRRQFLAAAAHRAAAIHADRASERQIANAGTRRHNGLQARRLSRLGLLLLDRALEVARLGRQHVVLGLQQEGIEAAAMIDGLERIGRDPQLHRAPERVGDHGDVEQVRQEPPLGLDVGVAHLVADQDGLCR